MFKLNDERKRAKNRFEAARLEFENAKDALKKKKSQILEMFKDIDSDGVSSKSSKWYSATIEDKTEQVSCLKKSESD